MEAAFRFETYRWRGGRESMLRTGRREGPTVLVVPPLFEEANRTRATLTAMLRALADRGIGGALPDLPGQGDSLVAIREARLRDWRAALAAAASALSRPVHLAAFRGGVLLDTETMVASRWYGAPVEGRSLVRELRRLQAMGGDGMAAGNDLSPDLLDDLDAAAPSILAPVRVVRLGSDPGLADRHVDGTTPPWRTAEPGRDDALAAALADDIAGWIATCDAL